jgi:hypothetical protein
MSRLSSGLRTSLRASERHSAAMAIESSTSVGQSGARSSSVGCLSEGRIDHQM